MHQETVRNESVARRTLGAGLVSAAAVLAFFALATPAQAQSGCGEACPGVNEEDAVPEPCDFITSGGFVIKADGKKGSFGAHGGCKNGEFWGHVNFVDHTTGYHVNSVEITGYTAPFGVDVPTRDICGWATTNASADAQPMRFRVRLTDLGEPGRDDEFGILLAADATASSGNYSYGFLPLKLADVKPGGGNAELHKPNPSNIAPLNPADCGGLSFATSTPLP